MNTALTPAQIRDLIDLHVVAERYAADIAIIGAAALLCFIDIGRFTRDIDLVVALDLEEFAAFSDSLRSRGWRREKRSEHRWHGPNDSILDLLPAGPKLRRAGRVVWPASDFEMSLVGFEHVFTRAQLVSFADGVQYRVAPPPVIALLKIVAFMDDRHRREKDLVDIAELFRHYEAASDRIFSDLVLAADLEDIEDANAFLLGLDVGSMATDDEIEIVRDFVGIQSMGEEQLKELDRSDIRQRDVLLFQRQLRVFWTGLKQSKDS
jgi:predicted nucleotidyltransferase